MKIKRYCSSVVPHHFGGIPARTKPKNERVGRRQWRGHREIWKGTNHYYLLYIPLFSIHRRGNALCFGLGSSARRWQKGNEGKLLCYIINFAPINICCRCCGRDALYDVALWVCVHMWEMGLMWDPVPVKEDYCRSHELSHRSDMPMEGVELRFIISEVWIRFTRCFKVIVKGSHIVKLHEHKGQLLLNIWMWHCYSFIAE